MTNKIALWFLTGIIVISIAVFGITVYNGSKPIKLSESEIKITEKPGSNENEKIITVDAGDHVLFYSFDGGETFQTDNSYTISENKSVSIVLQDNERRTIGKKNYNVSVVATTSAPTIDLKNVPSEIKTGSNIDVKNLVTAKDQNNNIVDVIANSDIDMSKPGTYNITYTATDTNGKTTTITTQVVVKDDANTSTTPSGNSGSTTGKKTYYRYRTKSVSDYACKYYNCDYTDHNQTTQSTLSFGKDSYCCNVSGCTKTNPQVSNPCPSLDGNSCLMNMVPQYTTQGNVCYNREYIRKNEPGMLICKNNNVCYYEIGQPITNPGENYLLVDINHYNSSNYNGQLPICDSNGKCYVYIGQENPYDGYNYLPEDPSHYWVPTETLSHYKKECSTGEIKIDGYCHKIDSYGTVTCPSGYVNENGTCYKRIAKTCNDTCHDVTWSDWSAWSTTKIIASDTVEVQTKTE